ncbi:hypothetical protein ASF49_01660 [Methylobacterium sp. Leaf104]|nr:hypothetical protein ASF49_01660 [Methylobacterium sp. Leaf104]
MGIRAWAESINVFSQGRAVAPPGDVIDAPASFAATAGIFVTKPITAVGFSAGSNREPRIYIYTRRALNRKELAALKETVSLGVAVEFRVAHPFQIDTAIPPAQDAVALLNGRVTCGSSISPGNIREAGTMGAILRDKAGKLFGLSCNHVTGGCSNARVECPIVTPGILDVGAGFPDPRTVGHHRQSLVFHAGDPATVQSYKVNRDAAVFELSDADIVSSSQGTQYDTPVDVAEPDEDMEIEKVGRTTGHTVGMIDSEIVGPIRIDYEKTIFHGADEMVPFKASVFFEPVYLLRGYGNMPFAVNGDSGALVCTRPENGKRKAVGLVIGGRGGVNETLMLPLAPILKDLDMELVSGHHAI